MRNNSWKSMAVVGASFLLGGAAGLAVMSMIPEEYERFKGLAMFGTLIAVAVTSVFVAVRIFRIGED